MIDDEEDEEEQDESLQLGAEFQLTPEGYGFSSPASRILKAAGRDSGYFAADATTPVIDVIAAITDGMQDVSLVFDNDSLLGIFTETDYIKVRVHACMQRRLSKSTSS